MKLLSMMLATVFLASCSSTVNLVHKTGSTLDQRQNAVDQCKIASFRDIPVAMTTESFGGMYDPGYVVCGNRGDRRFCRRAGGIYVPPTVRSYDANQKLRSRYIKRCLASGGYDILTVPRCTSTADRQQYETRRNRQPPTTRITCASGQSLDKGLL
ncbi:MAG: hypothetical protein ACRECW_00665 [Phyllobacterium sp.]